MFRSSLRLHRTALVSACVFALAACGSSSNQSGAGDSASAAASNDVAAAPSADAASAATGGGGALRSFAGDNVCDILAVSVLQSEFGAPAEVTVQPNPSKREWRCSYSWPRPDAEARQQAAIEQMLKQATLPPDQRGKLDMRAMATDFSVSVALTESKSTPENFVPAKLDDEQLEARIKVATEAANKRLTDEQKKALGEGGTESVTARMIRAANARVELEGVGDAAYWMPAMGGSLLVLDGDLQVTISPLLGDDDASNMDGAKRVFAALGK
ncbi:MAG: hypothetical protein KDJ14_10875 [Xanthomonadales bacterium]|nr:hypothetical protein [Xanthomonadales bacterium]